MSIQQWENPGKFKRIWCSRCKRVHKRKEWEKRGWSCPTWDCCSNLFSAYPWIPESIPRINNPHYPEIPIEGKEYPIFDEGRG
jgi:hypothetical protein